MKIANNPWSTPKQDRYGLRPTVCREPEPKPKGRAKDPGHLAIRLDQREQHDLFYGHLNKGE